MDPRTEDTTMSTHLTAEALLAEIDARSRGPLGTANPVAVIDCPHCGGRMEAIDAKAHVQTMHDALTAGSEA